MKQPTWAYVVGKDDTSCGVELCKWLYFRFELELRVCDLKLVQIGLKFLQTRLADVHEYHAGRGCSAQPTFSIESQFGIPALLMRCSKCEAFHCVL